MTSSSVLEMFFRVSLRIHNRYRIPDRMNEFCEKFKEAVNSQFWCIPQGILPFDKYRFVE